MVEMEKESKRMKENEREEKESRRTGP